MAKRKFNRPGSSSQEKPSLSHTPGRSGQKESASGTDAEYVGLSPAYALPSWLQAVCSLAIVFHFAALLVALSSNLAPSYLQGKLLDFFSPYLVTTHQAYRAAPLELTHAETLDFPLVVELRSEDGSEPQWQPLSCTITPPSAQLGRPTGWAHWNNFARWFTLTADQQPEAEVLADIAAGCIALAELQSGQRYEAIRMLTRHVNSFDEDNALQLGLATMEDEAYQPLELFRAAVIRRESRPLSLVPAQQPLRTSKPTGRRSAGTPAVKVSDGEQL